MDSDNDDDSYSYYTAEERRFIRDLRRVRNNDPDITALLAAGLSYIPYYANERWEEIGRDISNNTHLEKLELRRGDGALNDDKASYLFRGLTRSSSIEDLHLSYNGLGVAAVRSMVPFLQNANNLRELDLDGNNIKSEGFNFLCRSLRDSSIEKLSCGNCGIKSIEIDTDHFPRSLTQLHLASNNINADGCREITKLLQRGDSTRTWLRLDHNKIDDEGVAILVDALRSNTSLTDLMLTQNNDISKEGLVMLLKLVNDISSIEATLQSNHTLRNIFLHPPDITEGIEILRQIHKLATKINRQFGNNPEAAGREKVIQTQLHSVKRTELSKTQGVSQSVWYGKINPLHLPEVLSLVGRRHGQGELYVALKSSIAGVISTVDMKRCIKEKMAELHAQLQELEAKLAAIEENEGSVGDKYRLHRNKRLRM